MAYWLLKTKPRTWSWDDQVAKGEAGGEWFGKRNYQARNNMRIMKLGDLGFFYHTADERRIVGVVEVCALVHPDSTTENARWECVDVKAVAAFPHPVTLAEIKAEPRLTGLALVRQSRLSVAPVAEAEWRLICEMGGYGW